jgi:hypothetical protein
MIYKSKLGSWNVYLGPNGEKMPRRENVLLKDLQVGDIIFERTGWDYESSVPNEVDVRGDVRHGLG